jgi:beta-galactosidase
MRISRRSLLRSSLLLPSVAAFSATKQTFGIEGEQFVLNGKPFQILSGSMHYPRVPREYWRDRMRKLRAMGLNTLCTYVFWNLHEPEPGHFDFTGNLDLAAYIRMAQEEGLLVLLRPGPYVCAEWEFGGFPYWLLKTPAAQVRSSDPRFLNAAAKYMKRVGDETASLQITQGGSIIMVQVENEYGSFGSDQSYLQAIRKMISDAGFDVPFFMSNGPTLKALTNGTLPDTLSTINFGAGEAAKHFAELAKFRQGIPRMCTEYWDGWFDHWGERHHTVPASRVNLGLEWMVSRGISVNLYMAHGGTSFGFMNGANFERSYQPTVSSYDYDAPLDEAGRPTPKFHAIRRVLQKQLKPGDDLPDLPPASNSIEIRSFEVKQCAPLGSLLQNPIRSARPKTMEDCGQAYGYILYRTHPEQGGQGTLKVTGLHDFAVIHQGERFLGTLDQRLHQATLEVSLQTSQPLDILVENTGRVNFGPHLVNDTKGITGSVTFDDQELGQWEIYTLPMIDLSALPFSEEAAQGPAFYKGSFDLGTVGDTFLDMRTWGKGCVWVNNRNLGRYWSLGPQRSLYLPAPWLKAGRNEVVIFDLFPSNSRALRAERDPIYDV